ncbi:MAG: hypothetical protein PVI11_01935, partial [Candidatus Aminicenantes bacterium]
ITEKEMRSILEEKLTSHMGCAISGTHQVKWYEPKGRKTAIDLEAVPFSLRSPSSRQEERRCQIQEKLSTKEWPSSRAEDEE